MMQADLPQAFQCVGVRRRLVDSPNSVEEDVQRAHQDFLLVAEMGVQSSRRHPGTLRNPCHGCALDSSLRNDVEGYLHDLRSSVRTPHAATRFQFDHTPANSGDDFIGVDMNA